MGSRRAEVGTVVARPLLERAARVVSEVGYSGAHPVGLADRVGPVVQQHRDDAVGQVRGRVGAELVRADLHQPELAAEAGAERGDLLDPREGLRAGERIRRAGVAVLRERHGGGGVGYDLHTLVDIPAFGGDLVPHVIRAIAVRPGGAHKGTAGIDALDAAAQTGVHVDELVADRGYTYCRTETFALPLMARRVELVLDLHRQQRGQLPGPVSGTVWVDGALFSTTLPETLRHLEPTRLGMTTTEKAQRREEFDRRQPDAFRAHGKLDPDVGTQRRKGPALAGAVRCPNVPASLRLALSLPTTSCTQGSACGCGLTITLGPLDHGRERQRLLWGSTRWAASYGRRTGVESSNAEIKKQAKPAGTGALARTDSRQRLEEQHRPADDERAATGDPKKT